MPSQTSRHHQRILAFQLLYSIEYTRTGIDEAAEKYVLLEPGRKAPIPPFTLALARNTRAKAEASEARISAVLINWSIDRLALADRLLLRMAIAELLAFPDIPVRTTLDEYIELAREFGDDESPKFVNGVLDAIYKSLEREGAFKEKVTVEPGSKKPGKKRGKPGKGGQPEAASPEAPSVGSADPDTEPGTDDE